MADVVVIGIVANVAIHRKAKAELLTVRLQLPC